MEFPMQRYILVVAQELTGEEETGYTMWWIERQSSDSDYLQSWAERQVGTYRNFDGENRAFDVYRVVDMIGGGELHFANEYDMENINA